jgi:hypothetical protein
MSKSLVEFDKKFIEEKALQALEGLDLLLDSDPGIIDSMSLEQVVVELREIGVAPDLSNSEEIMAFINKQNIHNGNHDGTEFDVEKDIVARMQPAARRKVKIRAKNSGTAKPRVVYESSLDE